MSSTSSKNLLLSQPKSGQTSDEVSTSTLAHTKISRSSVDGSSTDTVIRVEIPGVDPATVEINCENYQLCIACEKGSLTLPITPSTDLSAIQADILWGMLTLVIPQPLPPKPKSISVSIHDTVRKSAPKSAPSLQDKE